MSRICPNCSSIMKIERFHGEELDVCPNCAGIWFDADELRRLLAIEPRALEELDRVVMPHIKHGPIGPSPLMCLNCGLRLEQYHYMYNSPVLLHTCSICGGLWVEEPELLKMQQWRDFVHQPFSTKEKAAYAIAQATIEHQDVLRRQENIQNLCNVMRIYQPGWFGLLP